MRKKEYQFCIKFLKFFEKIEEKIYPNLLYEAL